MEVVKIVDTGTALIVGSLIGTCSMLGLYMLSNRQWFKKENFKIERSNVNAKNKLVLTQLRKEMGITEKPKGAGLDLSGLKGLGNLINQDEEEQPEGIGGVITNIIGNVIENNPEIVEKYAPELIKMITPNVNKEQTDTFV